jgi:hypothetical protein
MMPRRVPFCLFCLAAGCLLAAVSLPLRAAGYTQEKGPAKLRIEAEKGKDGLEIRLSDQLPVTLTVEGPEVPDGPVKLLARSPDWEVQSGEARTETLDGGRKRWQQSFQIAPHKPGPLLLELQPLRLGEQEITWDSIAVVVSTEVGKADVQELRDVLPPEQLPPAPPWWPAWLPWLALGLAVTGLGLGGWLLGRRLLIDQVVPASPAEWALSELERLGQRNLPAAGQGKRYHALLSNLVRRYVERRFGLHAPRQTTAEFLRTFHALPDQQPAPGALLRDLLERCDLVKFAGVSPSAEDCQAATSLARSFIEQTAVAPTPSPVPES